LRLEGDDIVHEVIGVVSDTKRRVIRDGSDQVYLPFDQRPRTDVTVVSRLPASNGSATDPLVRLVRTVDPEVAVIETMAIAGLGVYGVIAFSASLRTREMGIRATMSARPAPTSSGWCFARLRAHACRRDARRASTPPRRCA